MYGPCGPADAPIGRIRAAARTVCTQMSPVSFGILRRRRGRRRALLPAALAATLGVLTCVAASLPPPERPPYRPSADGEILQQVPAASDPAVRAMRALRAALDAAPASLPATDRLASAYIDFGREVGDAHYAGYAEALLAPWLARPSPPVSVLIEEASVLQFRHQFGEARERLQQALRGDPGSAQAWLILATIDMVQGQYAAAGQECARVAATAGLTLGIACSGNLRSYLGHAQQSLGLLGQLETDTPDASVPFKAWVQGLIAETHERLGNWSEAETHYRKALNLSPHDNFLLVAYADLLLDRRRPAEVLSLLRDGSQSDTAFLRLALAKSALHSADATLYSWIMGARFEALRQRGSEYFGREQARFALHLQHDPEAALEIAERNWQVQRAPWDIRVLLEAALAANRPRAARGPLTFLEQTKLEDPLIAPLAQRLRVQLKKPQGPAP